MPDSSANDSLLEVFLYETSQNTEQLEQIILKTEEAGSFTGDTINEIFRIMHTIKGSAAMMSYNSISTVAHRVEDIFYYIRENPKSGYDCAAITDLTLASMDYIGKEMERIRAGVDSQENDCAALVEKLGKTLESIKNGKARPAPEKAGDAQKKHRFRALVLFEQGCEMENIRAYAIILTLNEISDKVTYEPQGIIDNDDAAKQIREHGFVIHIETEKNYDELLEILQKTAFLRDLELTAEDETPTEKAPENKDTAKAAVAENENGTGKEIRDYHQQPQSIISVNVSKLDKLMDLMGEIVIAEAMVAENPDISSLEIPNFRKASAHLRKIIVEMQDMVMSLRLVPLAATFQKMHRIVRDMSKNLKKDIRLEMIGEETDVDKNIIEHISDPLIHLVRNSIDHGIESAEERRKAGKPEYGTVTLEAQNAGSDVLITVRDDGRGLNKQKILEKAKKNNLLKKPESELTDKEIYNMIFLPGFSTCDKVTEYSGRGVGMDVVTQNITSIGGSVSVESEEGRGMAVVLKIPLTVAIIEGMNIGVGNMKFTMPITSIRESFRPKKEDIFTDTNGDEMIMVRGECFAALRLHRQWNIETKITDLTDGILIMVEDNDKKRCVFADNVLGRQQVVVKTLPKYIRNAKKLDCLSGCTLLGDGSISLILDAGWLVNTDIV